MTATSKRYLLYVELNYAYAILRPLQAAILRRGGEVRWFVAGKQADPKLLAEGETRLTTVEQVQQYQPCAVLVPGNVVPDFFPGVKVEIFHGFFAGKHGLDHFNIRGFFDLYCPQGPNTTGPFQELAKKHGFFRVVQTGWPKLDPLFAEQSKQTEPAPRPRVLFASTFSTKMTAAPHVYELIKRLSTTGEWDWLVTLHPKMKPEIIEAYKALQGPHLTFIENAQVLSALQQADVMLCDTSSIISEFLMLQKPVVTYKTQFDGEHLINLEQVEQIEDALRTALTRPPELMAKIRAYTEMIHPYTDGKSSERVLDAVDWFIETGHQGLKKKPLNLIRKYKIRKQLKYYKF